MDELNPPTPPKTVELGHRYLIRRKPSVMSRMVALAVTCVTGTLLLS